MKKYIIRNLGWPFNDSTYEPDGEHNLVEIFSDYQKAKERLDFLNREFFLYFFDDLRRFQTYGDFSTNFASYNNKTQKALVEKFNFNPTIYLYHTVQRYSIFMFHERPNDADLDELIKIFEIAFFTLNVIDSLQYF